MAEEAKKGKRPLGFIFLALVLSLNLTAYLLPNWSALLIYDREAVLHGEIWRLLTAHLVHFDLSHLFYDSLAFGIGGFLVIRKGYKHLEILCVSLALIIGASLLFFTPQIRYYGGLSGPACGVVVYLALSGLHEPKPWRLVCLAALLAFWIKSGLEMLSGGSVLPYFSPSPFTPVPLSHVLGGLVAFAFFFGVKVHSKFQEKPC